MTWTLKRVARVKDMAERQGLTALQIAESMGSTKSAICGLVRRKGIALPNSRKRRLKCHRP